MKAKVGYSRVLLLPVLIMALASCVKDNVPDTPNLTADEQLVRIAISVPGDVTRASRALSETGEGTIKTVEVLMFKSESGDVYDDSKLIFVAYSDQVSDLGNNQKEFEVSLLAEDDIKLVVLANSRDIITSGLSLGMSYADVAESLVLFKKDKWVESDGDFLPMWGESPGVIDISANSTINGITLIRMVSKIDLHLSGSDATDNFKLETVRLYNFYTHGTVMPVVSTWPANNEAEEPHLPDASLLSEQLVADESDALLFDALNDGLTDEKLEYAIYTFEAPAGSASTLSTNTCLIVGGEYKDGKVYYYRVDFVETVGATQKYLPLLRNYSYQVMVTGVYGAGYDTPEEALKSAPVNIKAEVLQWTNSNMTYFAFDGQNILAASQKDFEFTANEQSAARNHILTITTDYPTGWKAGLYYDADGTQEVAAGDSWLTISATSGSGNYPDGNSITLTAPENTNTLPRTLYIWLSAGRLYLPVKVTQSADKEGYLLIETLTGDELTDLIFVGQESDIPDGDWFWIKWFPANQNVTINYYSGSPAFDTNGIKQYNNGSPVATAPTSLSISGATDQDTGEVRFFTQPTTGIGQVSDDNEFIEKVVQMEASVTVLGTKYTKLLNIRHSNVNILTDAAGQYFILDNTEQIFSVRSSVKWRIKDYDDPGYVVAKFDTSQAGDYNVAKGTPVSITLIDRMTNYTPTEETVTVYFEWYNENTQSWDDWPTPAVLTCVTAERQPAANCYMTDPTDRRPIFIPIYEQLSRAMTGISATNPIGDAKLDSGWLLPSDGSKWAAAILWSDQQISASSYVVEDVRFCGSNTLSINNSNDAGIIIMPGNISGNAVVILYEDVNANGRYDQNTDVIKWSWHIWSSTYHPELGDLTKPTAVAQNRQSTATGMNGRIHYHHNGTARTNVFMDRNLGAIPSLSGGEAVDFGGTTGDKAKIMSTYGLYYQWGRKDPFPGPANNDAAAPADAPIYSTVLNSPAVAKQAHASTNNLAAAINNPLTFYWQTTAYDWFTNNTTYQNHFLWGNGTATTNDHIKTVYDPCPPGWRVPLSSTTNGYSAWNRTGVTTTTAASYTSNTSSYVFTNILGYYFDDQTYQLGYYPAAGYRATIAAHSLTLLPTGIGGQRRSRRLPRSTRPTCASTRASSTPSTSTSGPSVFRFVA